MKREKSNEKINNRRRKEKKREKSKKYKIKKQRSPYVDISVIRNHKLRS